MVEEVKKTRGRPKGSNKENDIKIKVIAPDTNYQLYTKEETAELLRIGVSTLNEMLSEGDITPTIISKGRVTFSWEEIKKYIKNKTKKMPSS